jgi:AraC-like DNA-binding protein
MCDRAASSASTRALSRLECARQLIDTRCDEPLNLETISGEAGYSPFHFIRLFREAFDVTPHQYLTERRIQRAKHLLSQGEMTVTEVCFAVGFQSLGSFSALFARRVGYPPAVYRTRLTQTRGVPHCFLWMSGMNGLSS